jgi:hypothetical protein
MKLTYNLSPTSLDEQLAFDRLVSDLKKTNPKPFVSGEQHESTKRNLARDPAKDDEWVARLVNTVPDGWKARPDAKSTDEAVAKRPLSADEILIVETIRRGSKNTRGQSLRAGLDAKTRQKGVEAFLFTPPAKVTRAEVEARAVNLVPIVSKPIVEEWRELTWWEALLHRLRGNKIRIDSK